MTPPHRRTYPGRRKCVGRDLLPALFFCLIGRSGIDGRFARGMAAIVAVRPVSSLSANDPLRTFSRYGIVRSLGSKTMIISTLVAAAVAAQPAPAPQPTAAPMPSAEKKMACCEKMAKGDGCACCKGMAKDGDGSPATDHSKHGSAPSK